MNPLTDPKGKIVPRDERRTRQLGEQVGRYNPQAQEYRKKSDGIYWCSGDGKVYIPLTLAQAQRRGLDTFE